MYGDTGGGTLRRGTHLGYAWEVWHNGLGYRCGYVRLPAGHPWVGLQSKDVPARVHGRVTFARAVAGAWWVGFDLGHSFDLRDPSLPGGMTELDPMAVVETVAFDLLNVSEWPPGPPAIRDDDYAEAECRSLCEQAALATAGRAC
jgi:hypothetical protein